MMAAKTRQLPSHQNGADALPCMDGAGRGM